MRLVESFILPPENLDGLPGFHGSFVLGTITGEMVINGWNPVLISHHFSARITYDWEPVRGSGIRPAGPVLAPPYGFRLPGYVRSIRWEIVGLTGAVQAMVPKWKWLVHEEDEVPSVVYPEAQVTDVFGSDNRGGEIAAPYLSYWSFPTLVEGAEHKTFSTSVPVRNIYFEVMSSTMADPVLLLSVYDPWNLVDSSFGYPPWHGRVIDPVGHMPIATDTNRVRLVSMNGDILYSIWAEL